MREWRKLHSGLVQSSKFGDVSDAAGVLYTLLIVAQDDEGKYPWNPTKIRALTVSRPRWSLAQAERFGRELVAANLAELRDGFLVIVEGREKNGKPSNAKTLFLYDARAEPGASPPPAPTEPRGRRNGTTAESEHGNGAAEAQSRLSPDSAETQPTLSPDSAKRAPDSAETQHRVRVEKSRVDLSPRTPLTGGQGAGQDALRRAWPFLVAWAAAVGRKPRDATARDRAAACDLADQERDPDQIAEVVTWMLRSPYHGDPARLRSIEGHWAKYLTERDAGACRCGTNGLSAVRPARPTPLFRAVGGTA